MCRNADPSPPILVKTTDRQLPQSAGPSRELVHGKGTKGAEWVVDNVGGRKRIPDNASTLRTLSVVGFCPSGTEVPFRPAQERPQVMMPSQTNQTT
jgi:hypothetical protein